MEPIKIGNLEVNLDSTLGFVDDTFSLKGGNGTRERLYYELDPDSFMIYSSNGEEISLKYAIEDAIRERARRLHKRSKKDVRFYRSSYNIERFVDAGTNLIKLFYPRHNHIRSLIGTIGYHVDSTTFMNKELQIKFLNEELFDEYFRVRSRSIDVPLFAVEEGKNTSLYLLSFFQNGNRGPIIVRRSVSNSLHNYPTVQDIMLELLYHIKTLGGDDLANAIDLYSVLRYFAVKFFYIVTDFNDVSKMGEAALVHSFDYVYGNDLSYSSRMAEYSLVIPLISSLSDDQSHNFLYTYRIRLDAITSNDIIGGKLKNVELIIPAENSEAVFYSKNITNSNNTFTHIKSLTNEIRLLKSVVDIGDDTETVLSYNQRAKSLISFNPPKKLIPFLSPKILTDIIMLTQSIEYGNVPGAKFLKYFSTKLLYETDYVGPLGDNFLSELLLRRFIFDKNSKMQSVEVKYSNGDVEFDKIDFNGIDSIREKLPDLQSQGHIANCELLNQILSVDNRELILAFVKQDSKIRPFFVTSGFKNDFLFVLFEPDIDIYSSHSTLVHPLEKNVTFQPEWSGKYIFMPFIVSDDFSTISTIHSASRYTVQDMLENKVSYFQLFYEES